MKRTRQVFLLVVTTALAISSVSALEGSREIPARLLPVPDTVRGRGKSGPRRTAGPAT
jgi:hypothetical protein